MNQIDEYAPGFKDSVLGIDILTPQDLESQFDLTGGNIFHGSMGLDQLFLGRPTPGSSNYRTPIKGLTYVYAAILDIFCSGLYLCGSGAHPGGGVMGSPGLLCANAVLKDK